MTQPDDCENKENYHPYGASNQMKETIESYRRTKNMLRDLSNRQVKAAWDSGKRNDSDLLNSKRVHGWVQEDEMLSL